MAFQYVGVEEAKRRNGLRMVVVGGVPSPWGEATKGIFHTKAIEWAAVRLVYDSEPLREWAGQRSGPVAIYDAEQPRSGWAEILLLAETAGAHALVTACRSSRTSASVRHWPRDLRRSGLGLVASPAADTCWSAKRRRLPRAG